MNETQGTKKKENKKSGKENKDPVFKKGTSRCGAYANMAD